MNKEIMRKAGFGDQVDRVEKGLCPICGKPVGVFRDELSQREFEISGLCQSCQDSVFGTDNDSEWLELE